MNIQIYTMQTPEEAAAVAEAGVDLIGVTPAMRGLPGEVSYETARQIVEALAGKALRVALTIDSDVTEIIHMVKTVQPDILHLCGMPGDLPPDAVAELRKQLPGVQIMQAVSVVGAEAVQTALDYQHVADYLILDTSIPEIPGVGASGKTHDWNISRAIVQAVTIPVILAGGLSPENVADAIRAVNPWGVDSLTHTNQRFADGTFRKDIGKVRRFVAAVRGTEQA
jgi:phosphoribosylanthranilate isomerase